VQSDTIIVVGAASRGIIQRGHESTAAMYKTYYAPNPFDNITEEEVEEYKEEIHRKTRGGICFFSTQFVVNFLTCCCCSSEICNLEHFVLSVPHVRTTFAFRGFSIAAPQSGTHSLLAFTLVYVCFLSTLSTFKPDPENNANFENYASHCLSTWL